MDHVIESILAADPMQRADALADALDETGLRDNTSFLVVDIDAGETSEETTGE
jgi:serine/threonine protein phosphatase PrpC